MPSSVVARVLGQLKQCGGCSSAQTTSTDAPSDFVLAAEFSFAKTEENKIYVFAKEKKKKWRLEPFVRSDPP